MDRTPEQAAADDAMWAAVQAVIAAYCDPDKPVMVADWTCVVAYKPTTVEADEDSDPDPWEYTGYEFVFPGNSQPDHTTRGLLHRGLVELDKRQAVST